MSSISGRTVRCPTCSSTDIDFDQARGDSACMQCGTVVEENTIVAEVGFSEDKTGRSSMIGQFVSGDGKDSVLSGFGREATAVTIANGRKKIQHLCAALGLNKSHAESSMRMFRMAVERNFHKGRRMANVACACLYFVCRREKTPHMLIDFSDVLETNVYHLGNTFLKFTRLMCLSLPIVDPSLYIHRFAGKLEFPEDKKHAVAMSALRLLARMKRDWMSVGRRPSGLCGAALIIAARMHNFHRSQVDVARVVRVGNNVLRERLMEIDRTPSANMTAEEIDAGGGDDGIQSIRDELTACDPPAYIRSTLAVKRKPELVKVEEVPKESKGKKRPRTSSLQSESSDKDGNEVEKEMREALASKELQELGCEAFGGDISPREAVLGEKETVESQKDSMTVADLDRKNCADAEPSKKSSTGDGESSNRTDSFSNFTEDENFSDLDEEELDGYLNNDEEYKIKESVWMEINKDYLEEQARLERLKIENPAEYRRLKPWHVKKKERDAKQGKTRKPATPAEAAGNVIGRKASKKLNYSVLEELLASTIEDSGSYEPAPKKEESVEKSETSFIFEPTLNPPRRRRGSQSA